MIIFIARLEFFSSLLEHVPAKLHDFADKNMLQLINLARFLVAQVKHLSGKRARIVLIDAYQELTKFRLRVHMGHGKSYH